jgi:hypothetical protein
MPGCLLAAMEMPIPVPQRRMPKSNPPCLNSCTAILAMSG